MVVQRRNNSPNNSKVEVWEMWIPCHTERGRNQGCNQKISWTWQYLKAVLLCKVSRFWSCTFRIFACFLQKFTSVFRQASTFLTHQIFRLFPHHPRPLPVVWKNQGGTKVIQRSGNALGQMELALASLCESGVETHENLSNIWLKEIRFHWNSQNRLSALFELW